jgi:hypothetical protein
MEKAPVWRRAALIAVFNCVRPLECGDWSPLLVRNKSADQVSALQNPLPSAALIGKTL